MKPNLPKIYKKVANIFRLRDYQITRLPDYQFTQFGFSLIELMVTITIMVLVLGGGIAGYMTFNDKQTVLEATNQLKTYLHKAQSQAKSGKIISCATPLIGYRVTVDTGSSPNEVSIEERCYNGTESGVAGQATTHPLPSGVTVSNNVDVIFKVLHGGVIGADGGLDIVVSGSNRNYTFTLKKGGEISEGG